MGLRGWAQCGASEAFMETKMIEETNQEKKIQLTVAECPMCSKSQERLLVQTIKIQTEQIISLRAQVASLLERVRPTGHDHD